MRLVQTLVENRRKLVDERTALSNRLTDLLKLYFPQILGWFDEVTSAVVGDLLEQWPSLQELQQAKPARLEKFLRTHHCLEIPERLNQIRQAIPATFDRALMDSAPFLVAAWCGRSPCCGTPSGSWKNISPSSRPNRRTGTFSNPFPEQVRLWHPD
jgi:transposase